MAESVVSSPASAPAGDTMSQIMADLGGDTDTGTNAPPSVDAGLANEVSAIPDDDLQQEDAAADGQQPEQQPEASQTEDESQKPDIPSLTETRWKHVHGGYKWAQEVGKALGIVGEDGRVDLSLFPPVEEVTAMRDAYSDRIAMEHDFASADPENAAQFIENWNNFSPQGMATLASRLPDVLATQNVAAYQQMAGPVLGRFLEFMYRTPNVEDPGLRQRLLDAARMTEWWLNGMPGEGKGFRSDDEIANLGRSAPQVDPREQQIAARERRLQESERNQLEQRWSGFTAAVNSQIETGVTADVEKVLSPLKGMYPNERIASAVRNDFLTQFRAALKQDTHGLRQFNLAVERSRASQSQEDQQALVNQYLGLARRAIHTIRGRFITEASKGLKQNSDAKHKALAASAAKVGPNSGGAPRQQSIVAPAGRGKDESMSEYQLRLIQTELGVR